jgi:hypothetical protein
MSASNSEFIIYYLLLLNHSIVGIENFNLNTVIIGQIVEWVEL